MDLNRFFTLIPNLIEIWKKNPKIDEAWIEIRPCIDDCFPNFASNKSVEWRIKRSRFDMLKEDVLTRNQLTKEILDNQNMNGLDYFWNQIFSTNEARIRAREVYVGKEKKFNQFIQDFNGARLGTIEMSVETFREAIEEIVDDYEEWMDKNPISEFSEYYELMNKLLQVIKEWSLTVTSVKDLNIMTVTEFHLYLKSNYPSVTETLERFVKVASMFGYSDVKPAAAGVEEPPFDD